MPIYYRADTRSPDEIFNKGFCVQKSYEDSESWWKKGAKLDQSTHQHLKQICATDADCISAVSLSCKLESAALFPLPEQEHEYLMQEYFIYLIALPEATKISIEEKEATLMTSEQTPFNSFRRVIDLHSLQTQQAMEVMDSLEQKYQFAPDPYVTLYATWPLNAYEALAHSIPSKNIIGAVRCRARVAGYESLGIPSHAFFVEKKTLNIIVKDFTLSDWQENLVFKDYEHLALGSDGIEGKIDYSQEKEDAVIEVKKILGETFENTPFEFGLGGKTFLQCP